MKVRYTFFCMVMGLLPIAYLSEAVVLDRAQNLMANDAFRAFLSSSNRAHYPSGCTYPKNGGAQIGIASSLLPNKPMLSKVPSSTTTGLLPQNGYKRPVSGQVDTGALFRKSLQTQAIVQRSWISSMVVPGLGQVYNQDYWKVPCLYLGFALVGHRIYSEHQEMHKHKRTLLINIEEEPDKPNPTFTKKRIQECERTRNLFIIIASVWYLLNILDAYAGGHNKTVNFKDDIGTKPASPPAAVLQPAAATSTS